MLNSKSFLFAKSSAEKTVTVKVLRGVYIRGKAFAAGTITTISLAEARDLQVGNPAVEIVG